MRATLLHAFLVTQYSGALLVRRPLRPRAGAVVRTAAGSVARCEEKITAALEPTSLRVAHRVDKTSVGRMERNGYRRSPTRRTTQMARTSPSFAYSARALSTASTHTEWFAHRSLRFSRDFRASNANSLSCGASATSLTRAQSTPSTASRRARRPRPSCEYYYKKQLELN